MNKVFCLVLLILHQKKLCFAMIGRFLIKGSKIKLMRMFCIICRFSRHFTTLAILQ